MRRADALLDTEARWRLFQDAPDSSLEATSVAGVPPDADGNVAISMAPGSGTIQAVREYPDLSYLVEPYVDPDYVDDDYFTEEAYSESVPVGFVVRALGGPAGFRECSEADLDGKLKCRTEMGIAYPLPLDYVNCPGLGVPVCD